MAVVGLVFTALLRNTDLGALLPWVNVVLHYIMPCAVVLEWLVVPHGVAVSRQHVLAATVLPTVYLAYVLIRGASTGWYPYPFLNPVNVGGYPGVAAYAAGIALTFLTVATALAATEKRRTTVRQSPA